MADTAPVLAAAANGGGIYSPAAESKQAKDGIRRVVWVVCDVLDEWK